ncbi:hypothetical protein ACHHYP_13804 [Achlya hypogyna]|uniref:Regulator of chromosome condensation (RCC1)-like protein n=1 Tax=Achlya hypogyna TaxID=1202772 RepID=A0A1V9ZFD7_ACHHY|nr:hypothetical protein ACHHYP_13804 [Achlya hypogyna]
MDITLLGADKYVEDRYKDLRRKRPEEKEHEPASTHVLVGGISATKRYEDALQPVSQAPVPSSWAEQTTLAKTILDLELMWPVTFLDKKHTVLYLVLDQIAAAAKSSPGDHSPALLLEKEKKGAAPEVDAYEALPLATQLAVKLFFKLVQSVRSRSQVTGNYAALGRLIEQVPRMLLDMPPLALTPDATARGPTVFAEIFSTIMLILPQLTESGVAPALAALVGLSIKRGRLEHLLLVLQQLLHVDPSLDLQAAGPFLQELLTATPQPIETTPEASATTGTLMSFGKGDHGKLGHGNCTHVGCAENKCTENKTVPTTVEATRDIMFKKIDSLSTHSVAITVSGELMSWGNGDKYRLGHGDASKEYSPRYVEAFRDKPRVQDVACGLGHTVVLVVTGDVYAWGNGGNGRLGLGDTADQMHPAKVAFPDEHEKDGDKWVVAAVYCGASHSLAVTKQGHLFSWGKNNQGQCGHGHTNDQLRPAHVAFFDEADMTVVTVAGGWEHTLMCTAQGKAYACGCGYKDSRRAGLPPVLGLGINDTERRTKPTLIPVLDQCVSVACGWDHSLAITKDGSVYSWGSGSNGKLGHGDEDNRDIPTQIANLSGKVVRDVRAGCEHTTAITTAGEMFTWGHSDSGRLGHGDNVTRKLPCYVEAFSWQGVRPVAIAVGDKYNLVLVQSLADVPSETTNQLLPEAPPPTTPPPTAWTVATAMSTIVEQLDRLAGAYVPLDDSVLLDKLRQIHSHPTPSLPALAFAVDVSPETFHLLVELVAQCINPSEKSGKANMTAMLRTCLRLVQVNLYRYLSCPHVVVGAAQLTKLHTLLLSIATSTRDDDIPHAAARALKIGFPFFYPTPAAQHALFWELVVSPEPSHVVLLEALTDQVCQDHVVIGLMARLLGKDHACVPCPATGGVSADDLRQLLLRLLSHCIETRVEPRVQMQLRVLAVLQTHLFAAWTLPGTYCATCLAAVLGPYIETLLAQGLTLLRAVHKRLLKDSDLSMLQPSFFRALAPLAIECCCVSRLRSDRRLALALLPILLPMLKLLDEITYKLQQDHRLDNQATSPDNQASGLAIAWIDELESTCALLAGRYASVLMASCRAPDPPPVAFPLSLKWLGRYGLVKASGAYPAQLRSWEEQGVYEVEHELQSESPAPLDATLDHVAVSDWLNGTGILHDLHAYMVFHMQHSWADESPLTGADVDEALGAVLLWHAGLVCTALQFAATIDVTNATPGDAQKPPEVLLQLWGVLVAVSRGTGAVLRENARQLIAYYPSQCSWTLAASDDLPDNPCSAPGCAVLAPRKYQLSVPGLAKLLTTPVAWPTSDTDDSTFALKIAGISIVHDLLRKLTSSAAKCELLRVLTERMEAGADGAGSPGSLTIAFNAWQEPRVVFSHAAPVAASPSRAKRLKATAAISPLEMLERDMHAYYGYTEHPKLAKAIENLFVRLAKVIASGDSSALLKKRALNVWAVHFHDVAIVRRAGILHVLGDLLAEDTAVAAQSMNTSDPIHTSAHGAPPHSCLPPRLRPVEKLVGAATVQRNLHATAWHIFAWLSSQLMQSKETSSLPSSRPSSAKPPACTSPRKRLSLPPRMVTSTLDEAIAHMYAVVVAELSKVVAGLVAWNDLASVMVSCLDDSQAILLADPQVVTSTNAVFLSAKERALFAWATDGFAVSLWLYAEPDDKACGAMLLLANGDVAAHQLSVTLEVSGCISVRLQWADGAVASVTSARAVVRGQWTHVVARYSPGTGTLELFLEGVLNASGPLQLPPTPTVLAHHTFTVGGFLPPVASTSPHPPLVIVDDLTFHLHALSTTNITTMAAAGSLLFRIKQREALDTYCTQLLQLLSSPSRALPPLDDAVRLVIALFPVAPPRSHDSLFALLTMLLPTMAPESPSLDSVLSFLVARFASAWFGTTHDTYGPPALSAALTTRKDSVLLHLLTARLLDPNGVATWLLFEQPVKAKSLPLLRAARARIACGVVTLLRHLLVMPTWQPLLISAFNAGAHGVVLVDHRRSAADVPLAPLVLAVAVLSEATVALPASIVEHLATSLHVPLSIAAHESPAVASSASSAQEMLEDIWLAQHIHLRSALLRLCYRRAGDADIAGTLLNAGPSILAGLLRRAIQPLAEAVAAVFGSDFDTIAKLDTVQALLDWILEGGDADRSKQRVALETLATVLFERLPYVNAREVAPWWLVNATQKLQVLGGNVEMEEYRVKGLQHFPTIKLTGVSITAGTGMWYYEVVLLTDGLMQIGWIDSAFDSNAIQGQGVGDHTNSWAYDGFRRKKWNVGALDYGDRWHVGDVVGVLLDTDRFEMQYFLNGRALGVAFEGLHLTHALFPAMSLNVDQAVQLHFAKNQFLYCPTLENAKIQAVANAIVGGVCEHSPSKGALTRDSAAESEAAVDRRRTDLIDGLVGLGFSPEWALRCARETSLDINESSAIAWIMEQMESDALAARPPSTVADAARRQHQLHLQQLDGLSDRPSLDARHVALDHIVVPEATAAPPIDTTPDSNLFLVDEYCEEGYADEGYTGLDAKASQPTEKNGVSVILSLADHCRDDEILPLYVIAETVLSVWAAQGAAHQLLRSGHVLDATLVEDAPLFLQYLQHMMGALPDKAPYEAILAQLCDRSPAFFDVLLADMLSHVGRATASDFAFTPFGHGGTDGTGWSAECRRAPPGGPNLVWAKWLATMLCQLAAEVPAWTDTLYSVAVWQELLKAITATANATVRHTAVMMLRSLVESLPADKVDALRPQLRLKHLVEWLAAKQRKAKQTRVLASEYTQALFLLVHGLFRLVNLPAAGIEVSHAGTPGTIHGGAQPTVTGVALIVEHITTSTVIVSVPSPADIADLELAMETVHSDGHVGLSEFVVAIDAADIKPQTPITLAHLQPDTTYHLRCRGGRALDAATMGSNLELLNHNMTVRNRVNKKWHAVRATVAYAHGVHAWDVRIDKCISKNIFVGVCTGDASLENYIGSDAHGWGFLANKAVWHNKTKLQTYGDIFKQGDVVSVVLDLDVGTLSFARNGEAFGVAVDQLAAREAHAAVATATAYYPAISMYNKDDQVTFMPASTESPVASRGSSAGTATVLRAITAHDALCRLFAPTPDEAVGDDVYHHWCKWVAHEEAVIALDDASWLPVDITRSAAAPFGLFPGDVVFTSKGMCTIVGVARHALWYTMESHAPTGTNDVVGSWKLHVCRDMVARAGEFPVTRRHDTFCPVPTVSLSKEAFLACQAPWTGALDEVLVAHLYVVAHLRRYSHVFEVTVADLEHTPVPLSPIECAARLAWLRFANILAQLVLPSTPCPGPLRQRLFRELPLGLARDLRKKTATTTINASAATDDLDDDPPDLLKCKLNPTKPSVPFWERGLTVSDDEGDDDDDDTVPNLFRQASQMAVFCASTSVRELRRQYTPPPTLYTDVPPQTRAFRVVFEQIDGDADSELHMLAIPVDQAAAYAYLFREVARVVQSPTHPIFVPSAVSTLLPNPSLPPADAFVVGQLMALAWRADLRLPLYLSPIVYKSLVCEPLELADWLTVGGDEVATAIAMNSWTDDEFAEHAVEYQGSCVTAATRPAYVAALLESLVAPYLPSLDAVRRGFTSVAPAAALSLLSAATLRAQLATPEELLALQPPEPPRAPDATARTVYAGGFSRRSPAAMQFWKVLHALSPDEVVLFHRFVAGAAWAPYSRYELVLAPASDASTGYPYVERRAAGGRHMLFLPEYASGDTMHKKLLLALTHDEDRAGT